MPTFRPRRFEQIMSQMIARVMARSRLSDVSDTSLIKHLLAASARSDDEQYYQLSLLLKLFSIDTARGDDLDERAKDIQPGIIRRILATKAQGTVVFSRNAQVGNTSIPTGTKVSTAQGSVFTTTARVAIGPNSPELVPGHGVGRDSLPVPVVADVPGAAGNVAGGMVVRLLQKPPGVDSVTNPTGFAHGRDKESDDAFRARIRRFVSSLARCHPSALEFGVLGLQDPDTGATILHAKVIEDLYQRGNVTLYVDDGTGTAEQVRRATRENVTAGLSGPTPDTAVGGETRLRLNHYPVKDSDQPVLRSSVRGPLHGGAFAGGDFVLNPASGELLFDTALVSGEIITASYTYHTGLIALAHRVIDGDPKDRERYPGMRAAGVLVRVATPRIFLQNVNATVTVEDGYRHEEVKSSVRQAIKDYINTLPISGDVLRVKVAAKVAEAPGVYNVHLQAPTSDVFILDDQMARTTDANIVVR